LQVCFLLIATHHHFSDPLVEKLIQKTLLSFFHVWTPFCKRFAMDYGGFPLASGGMERETWCQGMNWQKQAGLLQQIMYSQSGNIC